MRQKVNFQDRGHEVNNKETAWINGFLLRLKPIIDDNGIQAFVVETMGSSMDKIALLKQNGKNDYCLKDFERESGSQPENQPTNDKNWEADKQFQLNEFNSYHLT